MKKAVTLFLLTIYVVFAISTFWEQDGSGRDLYSSSNSLNENLFAEKEFTETEHFGVSKATKLNKASKEATNYKPSEVPGLFRSFIKTSPSFNGLPYWLKNRVLLI